MKITNAHLAGAYIVKAIDGRPERVLAKTPPPGWQPPVPTAEDKALVAALLRMKRTSTNASL